jgi:adenylosuccinate synthase
MKVNELLREVKFKNTFNALYKNFYKNKNLPDNKILELSLEFEDKFKKLIKDNSEEVYNVIDKDALAAHILFHLNK